MRFADFVEDYLKVFPEVEKPKPRRLVESTTGTVDLDEPDKEVIDNPIITTETVTEEQDNGTTGISEFDNE